MWKTIENNNNVYLIRFERCPIRFLLTNLKELWSEEIDNNEISRRFKDLNPLLNSSDVLDEVTGLLNNITSSGINIQYVNDDRYLVDMEYNVDGCQIKFKWELSKCLTDLFFKEITLNLISRIITLENRQDELICLLEKKDKEKDEYIREFGEISRDFLKTIKFNKEKFLGESTSNSTNFSKIFSNDSFVHNFQNNFGAKIEKRKCVQVDEKSEVKKMREYVPKFLKQRKN